MPISKFKKNQKKNKKNQNKPKKTNAKIEKVLQRLVFLGWNPPIVVSNIYLTTLVLDINGRISTLALGLGVLLVHVRWS